MHRSDDKTSSTPTGNQREPFLPLTLVAMVAPLLWASHFAVLYLLEGVLCAAEVNAAALVPVGIAMATLLCGAACVVALLRGARWLEKAGAAARESRQFLFTFQRLISALSLVAIIWNALGALLIAPCVVSY